MVKIFVAGHKGMVGSSLVRLLSVDESNELVLRDRDSLDLTNQREVFRFLDREQPDVVYLAAARVGGIHANSAYPAEFLYQNIAIATNVIQGSFEAGIKRLLFLGSSCIYPKFPTIPIIEEELLSGRLEITNEAYALAKILGIKLCEKYNVQYSTHSGIDYRSIMPCNLYGPGDNYHPLDSHVIPGLISKFHQAKSANSNTVRLWGSGEPLREFLYVDDLARACSKLMQTPREVFEKVTGNTVSHINVGSGYEISISELARKIKKVVGFEGEFIFDPSMPDGTPRKVMNSNRMKSLGWNATTDFEEGLINSYADYLSRVAQ